MNLRNNEFKKITKEKVKLKNKYIIRNIPNDRKSSIEIQKILFRLGCKWSGTGKTIITDEDYKNISILVSKTKQLSYSRYDDSTNYDFYENHSEYTNHKRYFYKDIIQQLRTDYEDFQGHEKN